MKAGVHYGLADRLESIARGIGYKDGYRLVVRYDSEHHVYYLQVEADRRDIVTGETSIGRGGKFWVTGNMSESQIVQGAFGLFKAYEEHECREWFTYFDRRIYGPHIDLEALMEVADRVTY